MAEQGRRGRDAALGLVGAVALGAVTASLGPMPATADEPTYPSWQDVQQAKTDTAATAAEATRITGLITGLQDSADAAGRTAQIAAERFHIAKIAEDAARERHQQLAEQADVAQATARTSHMRAGLLAAHLARSTGGETSADLFLNAGGADSLLYRLATMSQISAQSQQIYHQATADERQAEALGAQADVAATVLQQRADAAKAALDEAQQASAAASAAVAAEQQHANRLLAQLADLQQTSTRVAAQYVAGVQHDRDVEAAAAAAAAEARRTAAEQAQRTAARSSSRSPAPSSSSSSSAPSGDSGDSGGSAPAAGSAGAGASDAGSAGAPTTDPGSSSPSAAPSPPAPSPPAAPSPPPAPNSAQAASAVAFARDQIGDMYRFAGAGPNSWDCSGLTMQAYASIGIQIGGHSATAQYDLAAAQGELVPYSDVQVGDLIFYTDGGGDMYHVAVYSGSGMMIEAPYDGVPVREVAVRAYQRVDEVARPTA